MRRKIHCETQVEEGPARARPGPSQNVSSIAGLLTSGFNLHPSLLLSLQAKVGNRAVTSLLGSRKSVQKMGCCSSCSAGESCSGKEEKEESEARELNPVVQRTVGDGHDLTSARFVGDLKLESCYDDEARLTKGDAGEPVIKVQEAFIELGYDLGPTGADGIYGQRTWNAVRAFKRNERLGWEHMGDVGPGTMGRLNVLFPAENVAPVPSVEPVVVGEPTICGGDGDLGAVAAQTEGGKLSADNVVKASLGEIAESIQRQGANLTAIPPPAGHVQPCPVPTSFSQFTGKAPADAGIKAAQNQSEIVKVNNDHLAGAFFSGEAWLNPKHYQHPNNPQPIPWVEQVTNECKTTWTFPAGPKIVVPKAGQQCAAAAGNFPSRSVGLKDCDKELRLRLYKELAHDRDNRLLNHEQFHTKLTCVIADIGNDVIAREIARGATKQDALDGVWVGIQPAKNRLQVQYDHDSANGCNAAGQTKWEGLINQGKNGPLKTLVTGEP